MVVQWGGGVSFEAVRLNLWCFLCAALVFLLSIFILPLYVGGDQAHYRAFYDGVSEYGFLEGFSFYKATLSASEPLYYAIIYFFSGGVSKDVFISFVNALLGFFMARLLLVNNTSKLVVVGLLSNFYFLVLLFAAERLKFAIIFALLALGFSGRKSILAWLGALLSHAQLLLLLAGGVFSRALKRAAPILYARLPVAFFWEALFFAFFAFFALVILGDHVAEKFLAYSVGKGAGGFSSLLKPMVFVLLSIYYSRGKALEAFVVHSPLLIAAFLLGDDRIVILSYLVFMYYAIRVNRGLNLGVFSTSIYFFVKGIFFVENIFLYGDGFHAP